MPGPKALMLPLGEMMMMMMMMKMMMMMMMMMMMVCLSYLLSGCPAVEAEQRMRCSWR
jgi:hypothetical protein